MTEKVNSFLSGTIMASLSSLSTFNVENMKVEEISIYGELINSGTDTSNSFNCSGLLEVKNTNITVNKKTVLTTGNLFYKTADNLTVDNSITIGILKLIGITSNDSPSYNILVPKALSTNNYGLVKVSYAGVAIIIE